MPLFVNLFRNCLALLLAAVPGYFSAWFFKYGKSGD
jgi:hypothetical protein